MWDIPIAVKIIGIIAYGWGIIATGILFGAMMDFKKDVLPIIIVISGLWPFAIPITGLFLMFQVLRHFALRVERKWRMRNG